MAKKSQQIHLVKVRKEFDTWGDAIIEAIRNLREWQFPPNEVCSGMLPIAAIIEEREEIYVASLKNILYGHGITQNPICGEVGIYLVIHLEYELNLSSARIEYYCRILEHGTQFLIAGICLCQKRSVIIGTTAVKGRE